MTILIYWFRNDLRLYDNPAFHAACQKATTLLPVYCHDSAQSGPTRWGFERVASHRRHFLQDTLTALRQQLQAVGSDLLELQGRPEEVLVALAKQLGATELVCESIIAPEEQRTLDTLRSALGEQLQFNVVWQSSLLNPAALPFRPAVLPQVFTAFRHAVEKANVKPPAPLSTPVRIPPLPDAALNFTPLAGSTDATDDPRSSFPYRSSTCRGGSQSALEHLHQYFERRLVDSYKTTRNGLTGIDYSSKFSPWLASGAISARTIYAALADYEAEHGANDGSYWLWFELLWRDYFRFLHWQHGVQLYRANGLAGADYPAPSHNSRGFNRWCRGETGEELVDAGMRELAATGYLSNRLRQVVASYLVHDLRCDWRAGAAWFEAQLLDYDVYSNQGNWLYLAGRGTDPRTGRRFNPKKQAQDYDPSGAYRRLWA